MSTNFEQATGLKISSDELDEIVNRICFFAPSGSGAYLRELHEFLALQALSMLPSKLYSAREIFQKLVQTIGSRFEYEEILDALARLVPKGNVYCDNERPHDSNAMFRLDVALQNKMREQVDGERKLEREVLQSWQASIRKKYPSLKSSEIEQLSNDLKIFALRLLSQHSIETLNLYYGDDEALLSLLSNLEQQDVSVLWEKRDEVFTSLRLQEVTAFFREADEKRKQYISSLMHSIFILQLTQLDPKCAAIVRSQLSSAKIYLDTNFVFRLVGLQGPDLYLASKKLAEISQRLGFQLVVSPQTLAEYDHTVVELLKEIKGKPILTSDLAELALSATSDEDFITAYWKRLKEQRTYIDPSIFYEYYRYSEQLLKDLNVQVDYTFDAEILQRDSELAEEESLLRQVMSERHMRSADRASSYILRHDAYHRLLILQYRRGLAREIFTNARAWFLTCDTKLSPYDRAARHRQNMSQSLPFCVTSGQWLQTLRPFTGSNGELDIAQVDMLVSPLLRAYQRPPSRLINSVVSRLAANSNYSPSVVGAMLSDRQFLEQFEAAKENVDTQQDIIDNYFAAYASEMEVKVKELDQKLSQTQAEAQAQNIKVEQELLERKRAVAELESKNRNLETEKDSTYSSLELTKQELRLERERNERERSEQQQNYERQIRQIQETSKTQLAQTRRQIAFTILILIGLFLFLSIRRPWEHSVLEAIGIISLAVYLILLYILNFWRTTKDVFLTLVGPAVLIFSYIINLIDPNLTNTLTIASILLGAIAFLFEYSKREKHN